MSGEADHAGMAAVLLVESLMLALVEAGVVAGDEIAGSIDDVLAVHRGEPAAADCATTEAAARLVQRIADRLLGAVPRRRGD